VPNVRDPLVSAIIPVHNGRDYIRDAIESVLRQTYVPIECVVVDDGSTDDTVPIISRYREDIVLVRTPNRGVASARNLGASHARGEFLAFLDADDVWLRHKIELQMSERCRDPSVGLIYSAYWIVNADLSGHRLVRSPDEGSALRKSILMRPPGIQLSSTGVVPRGLFAEVGGFDERLTTSADLDLTLRVLRVARACGVDVPLSLYRRHAGQMSMNLDAMDRDMRVIFDKLFGDPHLPSAIRRLRSRAEAQLALIVAMNLIRQGEVVRGTMKMGRSLMRDPRAFATTVARRMTAE